MDLSGLLIRVSQVRSLPGSPITKTWVVGTNSRQTVNINADAGPNLSISAKVESKQPIIVERPMYFNFNGWTGGHEVVGLTQ